MLFVVVCVASTRLCRRIWRWLRQNSSSSSGGGVAGATAVLVSATALPFPLRIHWIRREIPLCDTDTVAVCRLGGERIQKRAKGSRVEQSAAAAVG